MIGHVLLMFTEAQLDEILTHRMRALHSQGNADGTGGPCLLQTASRVMPTYKKPWRGLVYWGADDRSHVGTRYDALCHRFGAPRVNAAIRNRILSTRARRILQQASVSRDTEVDAQAVGACRFGRDS